MVLAAQAFMLCRMQVKMCEQVFDLKDVTDRVECLAASVAIYRLFAALLALAPVRNQRAAFYFPLTRPDSTYITFVFSSDGGAGSVVRKEIFEPGKYFAKYRLDFDDLEVGDCALCHCSVICFQDYGHVERLASGDHGRSGQLLWCLQPQSGAMTGTPELSTSLQKAYQVAKDSEHMVHANWGPRLQKRLHPQLGKRIEAYYVQLNTLGSRKDISRYILGA
ncbi:MAG: hypothetical protein ACRDZY_04680 [Acidimicrobiales bacterium]